VLKISRYYFLDNFMENFQKTIFQINLQFSVFSHTYCTNPAERYNDLVKLSNLFE
jgi:hypothetical protein